MSKFAERLKELRLEKGLGQKQLAKLIGVASGAIAFWELDKRTPSLDNAMLVAKFFGVSLDYLSGMID